MKKKMVVCEGWKIDLKTDKETKKREIVLNHILKLWIKKKKKKFKRKFV